METKKWFAVENQIKQGYDILTKPDWDFGVKWVASTVNADKMPMEEVSYNSRLIASSPELLTLLRDAKEALEWYMENTNPMDNDWQTFHDLGMNIRMVSETIINYIEDDN